MQFYTIPSITLDSQEEQELVGSIKDLYENLKQYYKLHYDKYQEIHAAENCKNPKDSLFKNMTFNEYPTASLNSEDKGNRPNVNLGLHKAIANSVISSHYDSIFRPGFLTFIPLDQNDYQLSEDLTDAFNAYRQQSGINELEKQIIHYCVWYGNCPILIHTDGRINAVHKPIITYQMELQPEIIQAIAISQNVKLPNVIKFVEREQEVDGEVFDGLIVSDAQTNEEVFRIAEEQGIKPLDQFKQMLLPFGVDLSKAQIIDIEYSTTEKWMQYNPKPRILPVTNVYITPPQLNENEDTFSWIYYDTKRTQDVIDNPQYDLNKDKLKENDELIGSTMVNNSSDQSRFRDVSSLGTYNTVNEKVVNFKMAYFDCYRFKTTSQKEPKVLRNFIACTINDQILIQCIPNIHYTEENGTEISKNPLIWATYEKRPNENIGIGPILDVNDLGKAANILANYALDTYARTGNMLAYLSDIVEPKTFNNGTAMLLAVDSKKMARSNIGSIQNCITSLSTDSSIPASALQLVNMFKDLMHSVSSSQFPFLQGNEPTATQVVTMNSQSNAIQNTVTAHICRFFIDIYSRVLDELIQNEVVVDNIMYFDKGQERFVAKQFNFGSLKGKKFVPNIANIDPNFTKVAQASVLKELLVNMIQSQDEDLNADVKKDELIRKILRLQGIDDIDLLRDKMEAQQWKIQNVEKEQIYAMYVQQQKQVERERLNKNKQASSK